MENSSKQVQVSFPLFSILGVLFIALKLTGYIDWSWWWVLSPFWIPIGIAAAFMLVCIGLMGISRS